MTDCSHRRAGAPRAYKTSATTFLVVAAILLGACTTPSLAPASASKSATADTPQRSSKSSGIAYQEGVVSIARIAPPMVGLAGAHRMGSAGPKSASWNLDYQCPYCRGFHDQVFPKLKMEYVDTRIAQFIHKDLPLKSIHPQALPAALAASCAGAQQRFWPMHEALYANNAKLSPTLYPQLARELGLDEAKFGACLGDASRTQVIMRDVAEARRLNITGTPSFVIGTIEGDVLTVVRMAKGAPSFGSSRRKSRNCATRLIPALPHQQNNRIARRRAGADEKRRQPAVHAQPAGREAQRIADDREPRQQQ
jgi:protein-disulfide isomerase